ncbi:MAG TPA: thioredoxin domain-containing protein [Gemmatimonadales bacterium]|nr:thioredoxin domain-containing protein [Gemmatimonadales bacterium]
MSNLLAAEPSAYLKSAAHQPVHWFPWSDAAFARAVEEDKPVLLDIGAVWCHWCHVMDGESYEDAAVAEILNRDFICIKVDRDERPDVDARYQRAVQALTGQGGWPLTAFLTPAGEVFFGGTYFPPENNPYGRPGFVTMLQHIARLYREDRAKVTGNAEAIRRHVTESLDEAKAGAVTPTLIDEAVSRIARLFDVRYGGFGSAPKFPHPAAVELLIGRWHDAREDWPREVAEKTLGGMARGGIRDHLGGGFHRYSVDERWIVPHFEKMSYDNSELLEAYLAGYAAFGDARWRDVASGIVDWVLEVMADRERGAFFTSQDADVGPGDDGGYWTWTLDEARATLSPAELDVARGVFDIETDGEMHHNPAKNVLWRRREPATDAERSLLEAAVRTLKAARDRRRAPYVDTTAYVNWNAMMASAFLHAGAVLDRPECNALALKVLERVWTEAWDAERGMGHVLGRAAEVPRGMLDDNVQCAAAFLDAHEATGRDDWRERAAAVMTYCAAAHWAAHWGDPAGGYFDLAQGRDGMAYLAARAKPIQDAPTPSPNGVAALVLARLWALTDAPEWRTRLDRQLAVFAGAAADLGLHGATLLRALDWAVHPVTRIEVAGPAGDGPACAMHLLALQTYRPRKVVVRRIADRPAATVCVGTTCSLPVATPEALGALLK